MAEGKKANKDMGNKKQDIGVNDKSGKMPEEMSEKKPEKKQRRKRTKLEPAMGILTMNQSGEEKDKEKTMWSWGRRNNLEIRRAMFAKGITQPELAKACGIGSHTLNDWLKNELPTNLKVAILNTIKQMPAKERGRTT